MSNSTLSLRAQAQIQLELRRRSYLKNVSYNQWLKDTSPQYDWDYPHLRLIQSHAQEVLDGVQKFVIFTAPPQHGKSLGLSVHLPCCFLDKFPEKRIIVGGYNLDFATSNFSRPSRRILENKGFSFGETIQASYWETCRQGTYKAFGLNAGITGHPSDLTIIDDPIKNFNDARSLTLRDKLWNEFQYSVESRSQKHTSIFIILTRWHHDDIVGRLLQRDGELKDGGRWEVVRLPALAEEDDILGRELDEPLCPELHPFEELDKIRRDTPAKFTALYQGRPSISGGNIIKEEHFEGTEYVDMPRPTICIQSIDANVKEGVSNSFSVIITMYMRGNEIYIADVWRKQCDYVVLKKMVKDKYEIYRPSKILIEDKANGAPLIQEFKNSTLLPILAINPKGSKEARLEATSTVFANKHVHLPANAGWVYDYVQELTTFPASAHDDQVDATSQGISYLMEKGISNYNNLL